MVKFTLRIDDETLVEAFDQLARLHGLTRTALIAQLMSDAVRAGYVPVRDGEGLRGTTAAGGEVTLMRHNGYISGGMHGLTDDERTAYEYARQLVSPVAGSRWVEARKLLESAGFTISRL